jgi:ADP-ribose pyrophosphatase
MVYKNDYVTVYDDDVSFPTDVRGRHVRIVESHGRSGIAVLALCAGRVALVRTYRYPVEVWEWGIPRGFAQHDNPDATARSELAQELGEAPDHLLKLVQMTPNSGLLSSVVHVYIARYATQMTSPIDTGEVAAVRWLPVRELLNEISSGEIRDGFTLAAVGAGVACGLLHI